MSISLVVLRAAAFSLAIGLLSVSTAAAQTPQNGSLGSPEFVRQVEGKEVWLTTKSSPRTKVRVFKVTQSDLIIANGLAAPVLFDQIQMVESVPKQRQGRAIKGALIGFGIGFGLTGAVAYSCWGDECAESFAGMFLVGAMGAGIGAAWGGLTGHDRSEVIFQRFASLTAAPILTKTRKGMAVTIAWR